MKKFYIGVKNEVSSNTLELYFTDYIYDGLDWSTWEVTNMVQDTIDKIKAANPSTIKIIINSLGGDVMIGLALYNYLKAYNATKEVEIIGFAASIASVIAMAGDKGKIKMAKNSFMIIHAAWSYISGNAVDMRKSADDLDKVSNEIADIYAQRSGKDASYFTDLWASGDYWMTGRDAKEIGLVDELFNAEPMNAQVDLSQYGFRNIPNNLIQASVTPEESGSWMGNIKNEFMKIVDTLKNVISGGKSDVKNKDVEKRDEILDMVENVLKPFAEAVDKAIEEVKPGETKPEDGGKDGEKKEGSGQETEKKEAEQKPAETPEARKILELQNQISQLTKDLAANLSKPSKESEGSAKKVEDMATVQYE